MGLERTYGDHLVQNPLLKQVHPEQVAQDLVQVGFDYLQRRLHNLSEQPVPALYHHQSEDTFPHILTELLSLCPLPLSCHYAPLKRVWPHLLDTYH